MRARGATLATAESCTGGLIAAACTSLAGSSDWFERGFVTYSNAAKTELLGVPAALIAAHGAVSAEVARAMAEGALARSPAQLRGRRHRHRRAGRRHAGQAGRHGLDRDRARAAGASEATLLQARAAIAAAMRAAIASSRALELVLARVDAPARAAQR